MHSKNDSIEIMTNGKADEVIEKPLKPSLKRYKNNLEISVEGSNFAFDYLHLLYYKCHKINPNCDGSYKDSPDWLKN